MAPPSASRTALDSNLIVEDVVTALTGQGVGAEGIPSSDLTVQMERAAEEFDRRTANAFCRALLDSLCDDPGNLRQLEALIILGLAHPEVLGENRISLAVEGRRLAILLERGGEAERARGVLEILARHLPEERTIDHELAGMLRRSGNTEELVERYMARAELAVQEGKIQEAIPWLQEILLLDRTRRDVGRMIRDLRYQEAERSSRRKRRNRWLVVVVLASAAITAVASRDLRARRAYESIAALPETDRASVEHRIASIDGLFDEYRVWTSMNAAREERLRLEARLLELDAEAAARLEQERLTNMRRLDDAELERKAGLAASERGDFEAALDRFKAALATAPADWPHAASVRNDIAALELWKAGRK